MLRTSGITLLAVALAACTRGPDMRHGGLELVYDAAPSMADEARAAALAEQGRALAAARLKAARIPAVVRADGRRLRVGLPAPEGPARAAEARGLLELAGALELREVLDGAFLKELTAGLESEGPVRVTRETWTDLAGSPRGCFMVDAADEEALSSALPKEKLPAGAELVAQRSEPGERLVLLALAAPLIGNDAVASARLLQDTQGTPTTVVRLTPEGTRKLAELTERIRGKKLAIVLDGRIHSAPIVAQAITNGELLLPQADVGDRRERIRAAELLGAALSSGPFAPPLRLLEERQVARAR